MRVLLDDRTLAAPLTGVGHYVRELMAGLSVHPEISVSGVLPSAFRHQQKPSKPGAVSPALSAGRALRPLVESVYRGLVRAKSMGCDLLHAPNHVVPHSAAPSVVTVHDLSVIDHPEWHPEDRVRWFERGFSNGLERATRVIAVSKFTRDRLVALWPETAGKVDVIPLAPRRSVVEVRPQRPPSVPEHGILLVGTVEPRKNVELAVRVHSMLPPDVRTRHPLVIAGRMGWRTESSVQAIEQAEGPVLVTGYLADNELAWLYRNSSALLQPSLYEGFGLPLVEAMACGLPTISSGCGSLCEIGPEDQFSARTDDPETWCEMMLRVLSDPEAARKGAETARLWCSQLSWERCVSETIRSYGLALTDDTETTLEPGVGGYPSHLEQEGTVTPARGRHDG